MASKYSSSSFTESPSKYFKNYEWEARQQIVEDLIINALQQKGLNFKYIPREKVVRDEFFGDDTDSLYDKAITLAGYVKNVDNFGGQGDVFSRFGISITDQMTITISKKQWKQVQTEEFVPEENKEVLEMPRDGDLLWFPIFNKMFEITYVEREAVFYQFGNIYTFDLQCELYKYNQDKFETGFELIDDINIFNRDTKPENLSFEDGTDITLEDGTPIEGSSYSLEEADPHANNNLLEEKTKDSIDFSEKSPFNLGEDW